MSSYMHSVIFKITCGYCIFFFHMGNFYFEYNMYILQGWFAEYYKY
jgi:hypothetical protein